MTGAIEYIVVDPIHAPATMTAHNPQTGEAHEFAPSEIIGRGLTVLLDPEADSTKRFLATRSIMTMDEFRAKGYPTPEEIDVMQTGPEKQVKILRGELRARSRKWRR